MNTSLKTVGSLALVVVLSAGLAMAGRGGGGGGHGGGGGGGHGGGGHGGGGGGYHGSGGGGYHTPSFSTPRQSFNTPRLAENPARTWDAGTSAYQSAGTAAGPDSWRYRSDNGRWWYWTPQNTWMWYGDDGQWVDYSADDYSGAANPYVAARPILDDPLPAANFSRGPITIANPATNNVTINYTLDGVAYTIPPGYTQDLREDRAWVIQFSRGTNLEQARYGLQSGLYTFTSTDQGWELYHGLRIDFLT